tara:strand:- start:25233 stop:25967 length:735 start_codon:yes stop_codon:yes gene_type:complete
MPQLQTGKHLTMDIQNFTNLMHSSEVLSNETTLDLEKISKKYPYFQAAKAVYLKGLKQNNNFKYNKTLKSTAAITVDRSVLFDYVTNFEFTTANKNKEKSTPQTNSIDVLEIEETLEIGKPLEFQKNESHSFNEWLVLSNSKPITRKTDNKTTTSLLKNKDLINRFINQNPSIKPLVKDIHTLSSNQNTYQESELMTETLAKVYLEQNKYSNAIKAYQILILKYPEKSGFFADQIKKIEHLKNK